MMRYFPLFILLFALISCDNSTSTEQNFDTNWQVTSDSTAEWQGNEITAGGTMEATEDPQHVTINLNDLGSVSGNDNYDHWFEIKVRFDDSHQLFGENEFVKVTERLIVNGLFSSSSELINNETFRYNLCDYPNSDCENGVGELRFAEPEVTLYTKCNQPTGNIDNFEIKYEDAEKVLFSYKFPSKGLGEAVKQTVCN